MTAAPSSLWTRDEAAQATGGQAHGSDWHATGVSIDSRTVAPGDLFIALSGPNHDGHQYVAKALAAGAAAALVERRPEGVDADAPLIVVADSVAGLYALGAAARARTNARIVGVTGSVGKTGTKEMLKLALDVAGPTHVTAGNLNNHLGVPLTLARMPRDSQFAVIEMGMNHPGEITPLTTLARPHVAIITTVEAVHMEFFRSTAEIAAAKAEIFDGLETGGTAILPRDNRHYAQLRKAADAKGAHIESFGSHIDASARLLDCAVDPDATVVFALIGDTPLSYRVGVSGRQWASNSLAVLHAALACGVPLATAAGALATMQAPKGRGKRSRLTWAGPSEIEVIDESYNASPVSMRAAIATLAAAKPAKDARRIAILGDMLELGEASPQMHAGLAEALVDCGIDLVFTAGPLMRSLHDSLPPSLRGFHAADSEALAVHVTDALRGGDIVMVKGSAGSRMGRLVQVLSDASATFGQPATS